MTKRGTVAYHIPGIHSNMCTSINPIYYVRPSFSLSLLVVTQVRRHFFSLPPSRNSGPASHSKLFPPPSALRLVRALHFYGEKTSALSSLVDSRQPTLGALSYSFYFPSYFSNRFKTSPRWDSNSRTSNASTSRGQPPDHRGGDRHSHQRTGQARSWQRCITNITEGTRYST